MRMQAKNRLSPFSTLALTLSLSASLGYAENLSPVPLAEVNGEAVTAEDLVRRLRVEKKKLQERIYGIKREQLDALIARRLLIQEADRRGMSVASLLDAEVAAKVDLVTETEIESVYQTNTSNLQGSETELKEKIRASLQERKLAAKWEQFIKLLWTQGTVVDRLEPPPVVRVEVGTDGAPIRGEKDAAVTIVEFSDFHCPFCKRVQTTLTQLIDHYTGKIKLVYRDFPLGQLHPQASRAAEAARCAQDQGRFWEYHDALFQQAPKAGEEDLKHYANEVGLDAETFASCLFQSVHHEAVQRDLDEGTRLGVSGTPAFFINGRFLNGAQPLEKFVQIIEEELARAPVEMSAARR